MSGTVFVTGAGAGIGAAVARRLHTDGRGVEIADLDPRSRSLADELRAGFHHLDVTDRDGWRRVVDDLRRSDVDLDGLVLNVGGGTAPQPVEVLDISDAALDRAVDVNLFGALNGLRALGPLLGADSAVVVVASVRGLWPGPMDPVYSAAKHALVGLVRSVAPQLAARGIRISAVCPGPTLTPATERYVRDEEYYAVAPWQSADAVADAVVGLLAPGHGGGVFRVLDGVVTELDLPVPTY